MKKYCLTILKDTYNLIAGLVVTFREMLKPAITVRYPWQEVDNISSYRGRIELVPDLETGRPICVACGKCAAICPSNCIHPGKPWSGSEGNSNELDMGELMERAEPYNSF